MTASIQSWLRRAWHNFTETQRDKNDIKDAAFPYHNGKTKVYYSPENNIDDN